MIAVDNEGGARIMKSEVVDVSVADGSIGLSVLRRNEVVVDHVLIEQQSLHARELDSGVLLLSLR